MLAVKNPPASAGDWRDVSSILESGRNPCRGHGNPLQYSCLENPIDRGGWSATVHGVAKSWTRLKRLSTYPWLRLHLAYRGVWGFDPWLGNRIPHTSQCGQKKKKRMAGNYPGLIKRCQQTWRGQIFVEWVNRWMKDSVISVPCPLPPLKRELHAGVGREPPYSSPRPPTVLSQACTQRELGHIIESPSACCQLLVPDVLHPLFSLCHLASPPSLSAWFKIDRPEEECYPATELWPARLQPLRVSRAFPSGKRHSSTCSAVFLSWNKDKYF